MRTKLLYAILNVRFFAKLYERMIHIKKSINAWSVDGKTGFDEMFSLLKKAGFDGVELNVDKEDSSAHSLTMTTSTEQLSEIKRLSEKHSLPVVSISTSLYGGKLGSPDKTIREEAQAILKKQLECADALGADGILVVPGGISDDVSLLEAWNNSKRALSELKDEIKERGIYVCVENVWNGFFTSPFDMCKFIDELDCDYIRAYYDVGNVVEFSTTEHWIEVLGDKIKKIHFKDFKRNGGRLHSGGTWEDITKGDVMWDKVVSELRRAGYDGYLTAEVFKQDDSQSFADYYSEVSKQLDAVLSV